MSGPDWRDSLYRQNLKVKIKNFALKGIFLNRIILKRSHQSASRVRREEQVLIIYFSTLISGLLTIGYTVLSLRGKAA